MAGEEDYEVLKKYNSIYLEILMRYKDHIEESERLNVSDLPRLVTPGNEVVSALCDSIRNRFSGYSYETDFGRAAAAAFEYINGKVTSISLPIQFWQSPEETIKREAGDSFDKAVLLCSMLINLGDIDSKVVIALAGESQFFIVYAKSEKGIIAFDLKDGAKEYASISQMLEVLGIKKDDSTEAYEFNNVVYNDLL